MDGKYDAALLGVLQSEGKIEGFLETVLGFLYRRTDFYRLLKSKDGKLGFPPGVALRMLCKIFQKYDEQTRKDDQLREAEKERRETKNQASANINVAKTLQSQTQPQAQASAQTTAQASAQPTAQASAQSTATTITLPGQNVSVESGANGDSVKTGTQDETSSAAQNIPTTSKENADDNPELTRQQKEFQNNPESYNGAVRDNYSWSQSITDLDLRVQVPDYIRKGRDVQVDIRKKHVKVSYKGKEGGWVCMVDGELTWEIVKDESIWSLEPGQHVHINFEKKQERWWEAVLTDEPKISVRKIDASRPMTDLDDAAQAKIEEMMYNDRQKKMGLPQSHEQKMQDMLKNAWNAEGSPFTGQEFDPSKFSIDPSGVMKMNPS